MAITLGQHTTFTAPGGGSGPFTSSAINTSGNNLLLFGVSYLDSAGTPTVSDSKGNTWVQCSIGSGVYVASAVMFYCKNPTVGSGHTFTVTDASSPSYCCAHVATFNNVDTASPFDVQSSVSDGPGTSGQPGSITPTQNGELLYTLLGPADTIVSPSINSSFTLLDFVDIASGTNFGLASAYRVQAVAAAINPTWSWTNSERTNKLIASFKEQVFIPTGHHRTLLGIGI